MRGPNAHLTLIKQSAAAGVGLKVDTAVARLRPVERSDADEADDVDDAERAERSSMRARGEEAIGDLAQALLDNPVFSQAMATALGAGERAVQAQRSAMSAVGVSSGAEIERLERRLRSLASRLDDLEDRLDELAEQLSRVQRSRG